jgi:hypothetical protein
LVDFLRTTGVVVLPSALTLATVQTLNVLPETDPLSKATGTSVAVRTVLTTVCSVSLTSPTVVTALDPDAPLRTLPHQTQSSKPTKFDLSMLASAEVTNLTVREVVDLAAVPVATTD